ncbi:hypothetical protein [Paenibacillus woosongensis]|uniref:hypothetical protein n=1 Tax=Paenibacillus woosongensis TaxID=307580 RepID=UPI0018C2EA79|nr:hypothetical protein [Paenibacillus woosongensis]
MEKAARHSLGRYWDEITNEAKNDLTEYLCLNIPDKYKKWNKYTNEGREIIEQIVVPKVKEYLIKHEVTLDILNTVK